MEYGSVTSPLLYRVQYPTYWTYVYEYTYEYGYGYILYESSVESVTTSVEPLIGGGSCQLRLSFR